YAPKANALVESLRKLPILHDELYACQTCLYEYYRLENTLVLPKPTPLSDLQVPRCCKTESMACAFTVLESLFISLASLRPNVLLARRRIDSTKCWAECF
ncbi:hypothetical protein AMECASPLE_037777, partial [Ameca splendens]